MNAMITGGTGLLGRALLERLPDAVVLSRDVQRASHALGPLGRPARWDPSAGPPGADTLRDVEVVFNLAGEPVAEGRWTSDKKRRIRDSRVLGTRNLVAGLRALETPPSVLISASAVGYYGDRADEVLDEASGAGSGFLAEVCAEWEQEALAAEALGVRVVCARLGVVLAPGGGALARMLPVFRMGAGGRLGGGRQWMPWVHLADAADLLVHAARSPDLSGPINVVSPQPVTNTAFTAALGRALRRPAFVPVPKAALRLAFGEMSEVLLASQRALPRRAEDAGYAFAHRDLDRALADLLAVRGATQTS